MYHIKTIKDVNNIVEEIDLVLEGMYKTKKPSPGKIATIQKIIDEAGVSSESQVETREFLENLRKSIKSLERLSVTLAFEPSHELVGEIFEQVKEATSSDNFVIETKVDPDLLGGMLISYRGKYKDISLISGVNKYFAGAKKIDELF